MLEFCQPIHRRWAILKYWLELMRPSSCYMLVETLHLKYEIFSKANNAVIIVIYKSVTVMEGGWLWTGFQINRLLFRLASEEAEWRQ